MSFSIRDLLLVTVVVALALGWDGDFNAKVPRRGDAETQRGRESVLAE